MRFPLKKKRLVLQNIDELRKTYNTHVALRYLEIAGSFLLFIVVASILIEFYYLVPTVEPELGFVMMQSVFIIMTLTCFLITVEFSLSAKFHRNRADMIDIMIMLKSMENTLEEKKR